MSQITIVSHDADGVALVRADAIVHEGLATIAKPIGVGAIAKATGKKAALVKAEHYAQHGAALAIAATATGKGRAATVAAYAGAELAAIVNTHGMIDYPRAMATVCMLLGEPYTYSEATRADGQRIVKRAEWVALGDYITAGLAGEQAKAKRTRYTDAAKVWNAIQGRADSIRDAIAAKKAEAIAE